MTRTAIDALWHAGEFVDGCAEDVDGWCGNLDDREWFVFVSAAGCVQCPVRWR